MKTDAEILPGYPIEAYLEREDGADWNADTRTSYRRVLYELQKYLGGKPPDAGALSRWQRDLRENGYHQHSINIRISAANNYFRWCGRYDLLMHHGPADSMPAPELTRTEYLRMLRAARRRGWHQIYLLVKLFVITGLPLQCLDQVTPQVVEAAAISFACRNFCVRNCWSISKKSSLSAVRSLQRETVDPSTARISAERCRNAAGKQASPRRKGTLAAFAISAVLRRTICTQT